MVVFAFAVSLYWALSGTAGLSTLGGRIEEMAQARDPAIVVLGWVSVVLKVAGGTLALALIKPWGRAVPRRLLLVACGGGAALLVAYGAVQMTSVALVALGVLIPSEPVDSSVLGWRLFLWEPWFLVWGLLLGRATWLHVHPLPPHPKPFKHRNPGSRRSSLRGSRRTQTPSHYGGTTGQRRAHLQASHMPDPLLKIAQVAQLVPLVRPQRGMW